MQAYFAKSPPVLKLDALRLVPHANSSSFCNKNAPFSQICSVFKWNRNKNTYSQAFKNKHIWFFHRLGRPSSAEFIFWTTEIGSTQNASLFCKKPSSTQLKCPSLGTTCKPFIILQQKCPIFPNMFRVQVITLLNFGFAIHLRWMNMLHGENQTLITQIHFNLWMDAILLKFSKSSDRYEWFDASHLTKKVEKNCFAREVLNRFNSSHFDKLEHTSVLVINVCM